MRWLGTYIYEWMRGPWPKMYFLRHAHGIHQVGYELAGDDFDSSPREALGMDIPNHLIPLSPLGRWQSLQTHEKLNLDPDVVYVSQILRAIETAKIVFPGHALHYDPRLNEKDFGVAHMVSKKYLRQKYPDFYERYKRDGKYWASKAPGGENYIDLFIKLHSILDTLRRDWANKRVVIVCHSAVMLAIRQLFEHYSPDKLMQVARQQDLANCSILHYQHANRLWGWRSGRFRVELERPPYKYWQLDDEKRELFHQQALLQIEELRNEYA